MDRKYEEVDFIPEEWEDRYIERHQVKDVDQKWKRVDIYKHENQANIKKGFTRIIMNFVDCDDIEGIGENVYTMSDSSVLFDGDGEHILSCLIKSSRKKAAKKQDREDVSQVENTKKRKKSNSDANIQRKKKKKKKGKKKRKKLPSLFKAFKSALKKDTDLMFKFETIADNLQSQVNNLREKINKIRDERADKLLNIFQGFEERLNDVNERLDDVEDED